ncbi:MAG: hypothetical protein GX640_04740 [Fibrobacter sp.]|nr:hypothetical protein [Fibrobacter sp.]
MRQIKFLIFLVVFISHSTGDGVFKVDKNRINYSFQFSCNLPADSLLHILYSFHHLKNYSSQFTAINLILEGESFYDVEFQVKYLFYASKALYRRTLFKDSGLIKIEMMKFEQNSTIFPRLIKSATEYRVLQEKGKNVEVICLQTNLLSKPLNWIYLRVIHKKMDEFMLELHDYIKGFE